MHHKEAILQAIRVPQDNSNKLIKNRMVLTDHKSVIVSNYLKAQINTNPTTNQPLVKMVLLHMTNMETML